MSICDAQTALVYCHVIAIRPARTHCPTPVCRIPTDRHNGGCNVGFCDGHSKWLKYETIMGAPDPASPARADYERFWGHRPTSRTVVIEQAFTPPAGNCL